MAFLIGSKTHDVDAWASALRGELPEIEVRVWPDGIGRPEEIEYTLLQRQIRVDYKAFPNLKAIFTLGAGVDHVAADPAVPAHVPIVRLVSPALVERMSEYVLYWVLHYHRDFHVYRRLERERRWHKLRGPDAARRRVGIMGLGRLGGDAAAKLAGLGFAVAGWSRTPKTLAGVEGFHGASGLADFLGRTEILVCLLPLTPGTAGIIDAANLALLPRGAFVINAARGEHVVDADLLAALDSGRLAAATLDVFPSEPLPADHPYWRHPKVTVTPHVASWNTIETAAAELAENLRRIGAGRAPHPVVDRTAGY